MENNQRISPFSYSEDLSYYIDDRSKYAGKDTLEKEYRNNRLGPRELTLMYLMTELGTVTSFLIREAMMHPEMPSEVIKLTASGTNTNPYRKELSYLLKSGIITEGKLFNGNKEIMKTYHICPFASEWLKKKALPVEKLYTLRLSGSTRQSKGVLSTLNHLAAINFHIRYIKDMRLCLANWEISSDDIPDTYYDAVYTHTDGKKSIMLSIRKEDPDYERALKLAYQTGFSADEYIFVLDSKESMLSLRRRMIEKISDFDKKALYITDALIHQKELLKFYAVSDNMIEIRMNKS